jgi:hypothetical protein
VNYQFHFPAALPRGKNPPLPIVRTLGGPQGRSGRGGEEKKFHCRELNPDRLAHDVMCLLQVLLGTGGVHGLINEVRGTA